MSREARAVLYTVGSVGVIVAVVLGVLVLATRVELPLGQQAITRLSAGLFLAGAVVAWVFLVTLIAVGWLTRLNDDPFSRLYPPWLALAVGIGIVLALSAVAAYERLHGQAAPVLAEPEVRLFNALSFGLVVGALGWATAVILRGRSRSRRTVMAIFIGIGLLAVWIVLLALRG